MASFPHFTNVATHVTDRIKERVGNPQKISSLNCWIRVASAAGSGLMLYSNPNIATFKAAGDDNVASIYGNSKVSGIIGTDWNGGAVYANEGQGFKPSPVISSIEVDEGAGNLSRKASFSITAFTKEQMELLMEYFVEPGYTVFLEWGWNTQNGVTGHESTLSAEYVSSFQTFTNTNQRRVTSGGESDNYLGFITGGGLAQDGDKWTINVELTGFTELPAYLTSTENSEDKVKPTTGESEPDIDSVEPFGANSIRNAGKSNELGKERFMRMFNDLPDSRKTERIKSLISDTKSTDIKNFINWDDDVSETINGETEGGFFSGEAEADLGDGEISLPKGTKLISDDRFIKFSTAMDILFTTGLEGYKLADGTVIKFRVNTDKSYCQAFPHMYSLDPTKLFIPNPTTPKFVIGKKGVKLDITGVMVNRVGGETDGITFPNKDPLNETGTQGEPIEAKSTYWGNLNDLYVNFDFFKEVLETKNNTIKDALYQILNGISSAVNGLWDFQIVERELTKTESELGVVDMNFVSTNPPTPVALNLNSIGEKSILIDSSLDLGISGAKMNQIIGQRLSRSLNSQGKPLPKTLFANKKEDKVLAAIEEAKEAAQVKSGGGSGSGGGTEEDKKAKKESLELILGKLFLYPKVEYKDKGDVKGKELYDVCYIGAFKDVEIFSKLKKKELVNVGRGPLMPIKFTFKIHGISGIKRGDMFTINGIPKWYDIDGAFFQVLSVKHVIDGMIWTTEITGGWRG